MGEPIDWKAQHAIASGRIRKLQAKLAKLEHETRGMTFQTPDEKCDCNYDDCLICYPLPQAETASKPPIGFGVPTLADRVKEVMMETGAGYESALQTVSEECELRSEAIFAVRQYFDHYKPEWKKDVMTTLNRGGAK